MNVFDKHPSYLHYTNILLKCHFLRQILQPRRIYTNASLRTIKKSRLLTFDMLQYFQGLLIIIFNDSMKVIYVPIDTFRTTTGSPRAQATASEIKSTPDKIEADRKAHV